MHTNNQDGAVIGSVESTTVSTVASTLRSSSIPLPLTHVHRTESEVQLSYDQATAEQREIHMFYRLLRGIRNRQGLDGEVSSLHPPGALPPRVLEESPMSPPSRNIFGWQVGSTPPVLQPMSQGPLVDMADSWSITGFDDVHASNFSLVPMSIAGPGPPSPPDVCKEDGALEEDDEGIFAMDL